MKIISIANQKGGVGKTTTTIEIGYCLANQKKKVLLIDFDQQANLTKYLNIDSTYDITKIMDGEISVSKAIQSADAVDVLAASGELSKADKKYTDANDIYLLEDICKLADEEVGYDYILIDNSPARNILLTMSYVASDYIIVPTECDEGAVDGIMAIEQDVSKLRDGRHPFSHAKIIAIILNKYEKTTMHNVALETIEALASERISGKPIVGKIRKSIRVSECKTMKLSLQRYEWGNNVASDYRKIVKKIVGRLKKDGK